MVSPVPKAGRVTPLPIPVPCLEQTCGALDHSSRKPPSQPGGGPWPTHHPHGPTGAHVVVVAIPAVEVGVVAVLQDELLAPEVRVVEADPGPTLHADRVHPVHEASILEVVTVPEDLQLPAREVLALVERDLEESSERARVGRASPLSSGSGHVAPNSPTEPGVPRPRSAACTRCSTLSLRVEEHVDVRLRSATVPGHPHPRGPWLSRQISEDPRRQALPLCPGAPVKTGSFQTATADFKLNFCSSLKHNIQGNTSKRKHFTQDSPL